jgi:hypothetical protein
VLGYDATRGICAIRDDELGLLTVGCEPMNRNENKKSQERGENSMETNQAILAYDRGDVSAGVAVDVAAKAHMEKTGEKNYSAAIKAVIKEAKATAVWDKRDFTRMTRKFAAERGISGSEAARAVADEGGPRMRRIYEQDPMGATELLGVSPPPAVADITVPQPVVPVRMPGSVQQVGVMLNALPRDPWGYVNLDQCAQALKPYPSLLDKAAGDAMNAYAYALIDILGLVGFKDQNFPIAYEEAKRRYRSLFALYQTGALTSQSLREMLPILKITD